RYRSDRHENDSQTHRAAASLSGTRIREGLPRLHGRRRFDALAHALPVLSPARARLRRRVPDRFAAMGAAPGLARPAARARDARARARDGVDWPARLPAAADALLALRLGRGVPRLRLGRPRGLAGAARRLRERAALGRALVPLHVVRARGRPLLP